MNTRIGTRAGEVFRHLRFMTGAEGGSGGSGTARGAPGRWHRVACAVAILALLGSTPAFSGVTQDIPTAARVRGTILTAGDADEYRIELTAQARITVRLRVTAGTGVDVGLELIDPAGAPVNLRRAATFADRLRRVNVIRLRVGETGTYRLRVRATVPCAYQFTLGTTARERFRRTVRLAAGQEVTVPVSAPAHSRVRLMAEAAGGRGQPRIVRFGPFDLLDAGTRKRYRHAAQIGDTGDTAQDFGLLVRNLSQRRTRVIIQAIVKAPRVPRAEVDTSDRTEIVSLVPGDGTVALQWLPTHDATSYTVYWAEGPGLPGTAIPGIAGTQYTHTGLTNGRAYYYSVSATCAAHGERERSTERMVALAPSPPALVAVTPGDGVVTIAWSESEGALSYTLYKGTAAGVTKLTGEAIPGVSSPYDDTAVVNYAYYYYVVTATGAGGESGESQQVAARPQPPPDAPLNVTATVTEETPNSVTITWDPPAAGADSYTIYWGTAPGVTVGTNPIADVTSPYVHSGLAGQTTYYYIVTSTLLAMESVPSAEVSATPHGPPSGGHDTAYGNNLSFPVVFADGYGITGAALAGTTPPYLDTATGLRPTASDVVAPFPNFDAADAVLLNGTTYFPQQTASTWQADWLDGSGAEQEVIVDWGDNLRSQSFKTTSVVRVETVLYQDTTVSAPTDTLTGYVMALLGGSGPSESQGTSAATYESNLRTVYTVHPRLLIEKLDGPGGMVDASVTPIELSVAGGFATDGSGTYGAEVNVAGKLVYGYVWMLRNLAISDAAKVGWWRLTFALDPTATIGTATVPRNTRIVALHESEAGSTAVLAADGYSTSIEVQVQ